MSLPIARQLAALGASPEMIAGALCNGKPIADHPYYEQSARAAREGRWVEPDRIHVVVFGPAPGKPRMNRGDKWKKRPAVVRYRDWCDRVRAIAGKVPAAELVKELRWTAFYEPPASWSKKKRCAAIGELHRVKPDASNILKGIEDCLWPDGDQALAVGYYEKRWDWNSRLEIEIVLETKT